MGLNHSNFMKFYDELIELYETKMGNDKKYWKHGINPTEFLWSLLFFDCKSTKLVDLYNVKI